MKSITTMTMHRNQGDDMPKVKTASGKVKKFPYTVKGKAAASKASAKMGKKSPKKSKY